MGEAGAEFDYVLSDPHAALAGAVGRYCGYVERAPAPVRRREHAHGGIVMIVSFGHSIDVTAGDAPGGDTFESFVAGFSEGWTVTEHEGHQHGIQIDLTPLGAYRLFGVPMRDIANRAVPLDAVRGRRADELVDRLASTEGWADRFALLDQTLLGWWADGPPVDRAVAWTWDQLERSHGRVSVGALAEEVGWSRRHFAARFRHQVGVPPKPAARVLRFRRAVELLHRRDRTIADVAAATGFADHSHLVRECRALAGCTPTELIATRQESEVTFVQDGDGRAVVPSAHG